MNLWLYIQSWFLPVYHQDYKYLNLLQLHRAVHSPCNVTWSRYHYTFAGIPDSSAILGQRFFLRFYSFFHQSFFYLFCFLFLKQSLSIMFCSCFLKFNHLFYFVFAVYYINHYVLRFLHFFCQKHVFTLLFISTELVSSSRILKQNITLISIIA